MFYMIAIPALLAMGIVMSAMLGTPRESDRRDQQSNDQLAQYRTFIFTAKTYFERNAAPASNTAYYWSILKAAATPAMVNAGIPSFWKAVRKADGSWVACTEMTPSSTAKISSLFPVQSGVLGTATISIVPTAVAAGSITSIVGTGGGSLLGGTPTYVVIGQQSAVAAASANLCAGT
jgi:hypothetical protein